MNEDDQIITTSLRLGSGLQQQLREAARTSVRSVNSEIVVRLRQSFEQHEAAKAG